MTRLETMSNIFLQRIQKQMLPSMLYLFRQLQILLATHMIKYLQEEKVFRQVSH